MKNIADRTVYIGYYLQWVEIKDCTVMTDGRNFFVKNMKMLEILLLVHEMNT